MVHSSFLIKENKIIVESDARLKDIAEKNNIVPSEIIQVLGII